MKLDFLKVAPTVRNLLLQQHFFAKSGRLSTLKNSNDSHLGHQSDE